jgi:hypothetical protein
MSNAIVTLFVVALMLTAVLTWSNASFSSMDSAAQSWKQMVETTKEVLRTDIEVIDAQVQDSFVEVYVRNCGELRLAQFDEWDVITHYYDDLGEYHISRLTYALDDGTIASDDFESGDWTGGSGWTDYWLHSGDADVRSDGEPHSGSYDVRLRQSTGYIARAVDLSGCEAPILRFWWKASSFETGEEAYCYVSPDGQNWTPVRTWRNGDDDDIYHREDIDLSPYASGSSEFWIAFDAEMGNTWDYFYIDDVQILDEANVNIWTVAAIYTDYTLGREEVFEPGILNPGEVMLIKMKLSPLPGPNTTNWAIVSSCNGVVASSQYEG